MPGMPKPPSDPILLVETETGKQKECERRGFWGDVGPAVMGDDGNFNPRLRFDKEIQLRVAIV